MKEGMLFGTPVNLYFLWAIMLIMALHMILPVPMYALKFKDFRLRGNLIRYLLLLIAAVILFFTGIAGIITGDFNIYFTLSSEPFTSAEGFQIEDPSTLT